MAAHQPIAGLAWYHVNDPQSSELDELGARFGLHELDIANSRSRPQRPKYVEHSDSVFVVLKLLKEPGRLRFVDLDVFLGRDFLITVAEGECAAIERIIRRAAGDRSPRLDRLFYMVMDEVVDDYMPTLDRIAEETADIEDDVLDHPEPRLLRTIFTIKRNLIVFRRNAGGMREVVNAVIRRENGIANDDLDPYFRDVYDHLVRTVDLIESYRDLLSGSVDIYLSAVANRTNEVMKVLTVYGTVALPLVIITGFFGMNLPLPWQNTHHGTLLAVATMVASTLLVLLYFKRKNWF